MKNLDLFNTPEFVLINSGIRYICYGDKKTSTYGVSYLLKTPQGNWIVANSIRKFSPMIDGEVHGDWAHGHYFMEKRNKAIEYFLSLK